MLRQTKQNYIFIFSLFFYLEVAIDPYCSAFQRQISNPKMSNESNKQIQWDRNFGSHLSRFLRGKEINNVNLSGNQK